MVHAEAMAREIVETHDWEEHRADLVKAVAEALTTYAAQQVQATWEAAIKEVEQNHEYHQAMNGRCKCLMVATRLRRRTQRWPGNIVDD